MWSNLSILYVEYQPADSSQNTYDYRLTVEGDRNQI
jgi:hypothetical protein